MSWLFSRALAEEYSADTCSDGGPYAQLNVMPTPHKFWRNDKMIEHSDLSQFGLTCAPLTEDRGKELLMSFRAAFRAKTSALPEPGQASTGNEADYGQKWQGSFARFDRDSSSWKTAQCSLLGDSDGFSETWPRWGLMLDGASYLLPTPALTICESASGSWPTPTASLGTNGGRVTPNKARKGGTLIEAVSARRWPTPIANDAVKRGDLRAYPQYLIGAAQCADSTPGQLNPEWVEWLMGWPIGWTDLQPLGMDKFREWRQQHSAYFPHRLRIAA
ncbi:hypothetical protein NUJ30_08185 [Burkholderia contaminans]|uniref:hypothetical protein n=1 Tax=unclassified Burkholderia TaxID=2613784 RepID=UPI00201716B5|nr:MULTISPECIES: hypothetical protein [Burkholderia]UXZ68645.1 hypothetical protein NUJ29_08190 [Burkholderia contaminans]UXZ76406.1 hypothetical protein NUJ30_08185 [Burkholderia contaminans]